MTTQTTLALTSVQAGEKAKEHGLAQVEEHSRDWLDYARTIARYVAQRHGSVTVDDVREKILAAPPSSHIWGCIFHGPSWEFVGYEKSRILSNRARRIARWKLAPSTLIRGCTPI